MEDEEVAAALGAVLVEAVVVFAEPDVELEVVAAVGPSAEDTAGFCKDEVRVTLLRFRAVWILSTYRTFPFPQASAFPGDRLHLLSHPITSARSTPWNCSSTQSRAIVQTCGSRMRPRERERASKVRANGVIPQRVPKLPAPLIFPTHPSPFIKDAI